MMEQNDDLDVHEVLNRTEFGPPMALSDALRNPPGRKTLGAFVRGQYDDIATVLSICLNSEKRDYAIPTVSAVTQALISSGYSAEEKSRFEASASYEMLALRASPLGKVFQPMPYIKVAMELGDWQTEDFDNLKPPAEFDELVEKSCADGLSPLAFMRGLGSNAQLSRHQELELIPISACIFVARRFPNALSGMNYVAYLVSELLDKETQEAARQSAIATKFYPMAGTSWLAWLILLANCASYWAYERLSDGRASSAFENFVMDVMPRAKSFGSFDKAAPYFQAGVPISLIPDAVANDIPPDIALALSVNAPQGVNADE